MTLKEIVDLEMKGIVPDAKTTGNNLKNIEDIKNKLGDAEKQQLDAVAAELKAHKNAEEIKQQQEQKAAVEPPKTNNNTSAEVNTNSHTAEAASTTKKTAEIK